ncbi:MAG: cyclodeaminase/cyclohydrolase family protein [Synergistaceae bacterium]|nr:cyclodeaminase/cyclohydrolase family protein [Synergistaceae bacterium]
MEKSQDSFNLLMSKSCSEFSELLAEKISMPGGGSAASLTGALGAALCSMAANFTIGKKNYEDVQDDVKSILEKSERIRKRFLELADEDAKAFPELSAAYKIPKDNPDRDKIYERAALNACKAPVEMIECCAEAIDLLNEIMQKGNKMLISDAGCGALLCKAAMESAAMNVVINTSSLKNCDEARKIESKIDDIIEKYSPTASIIAEEVNLYLRK